MCIPPPDKRCRSVTLTHCLNHHQHRESHLTPDTRLYSTWLQVVSFSPESVPDIKRQVCWGHTEIALQTLTDRYQQQTSLSCPLPHSMWGLCIDIPDSLHTSVWKVRKGKWWKQKEGALSVCVWIWLQDILHACWYSVCISLQHRAEQTDPPLSYI